MGADGFTDIADEVRGMAQAVLTEQLTDRVYRAESVYQWSSGILSEIVRQLGQPRFQDFKFVTSCLIASKQPNAFCTVTHSLWDKVNDGSVTTAFSSSSLECRVTVYGLKY
jgi:hypothetical protein